MIPTEPQDDTAAEMADDGAAPVQPDPDRPPEAQPEPEDESDEEWMRRFIEENIHLASPRVVRPPAPPPQPWDGPRSQWKVPDHLSMPHPNGGYMAMALMSRTMDDLDEVTGGKRAATYEEVDKYFGHALIAEGLVPFTYTAGEASRWWKAGGYKILAGASVGSLPPPPDVSEHHWNVGPIKGGEPSTYTSDHSNAAFVVDPQDQTTLDRNMNPNREGRPAGAPKLSNAVFVADPNDWTSLRPTSDAFGIVSRPGTTSPSVDLNQGVRGASAVKISQKGKNLQGSVKKTLPSGIQTLRNGVKYQDWGGNVGAAQKILERYPMLVKQFAGSTITIAVVPDNVTQYPIRSPGGHPRNWPKGATYKDVPALYYEGQDTVIIASKNVAGQSAEYRLLHELGHAMDYMKTSLRGFKASREDEFRNSYLSDLPSLKKTDKIHYFDNNTAAGWSETYAASFARMKTDRANLKRELPNIYAFWVRKGW